MEQHYYIETKLLLISLSSALGIVFPLVSLLCINGLYLYIFTSQYDSEEELAQKAQRLLEAQYAALKITDRYLKVSKCYLTLQNFRQSQGKYCKVSIINWILSISIELVRIEIQCLNVDVTRVLVRVLLSPVYNLKQT